MRPQMAIRGVRGSIFMPQLRFSNEILNQLRDVLHDWIPSVVNADVNARHGTFTAPNPWMMVAPDDTERLIFSPQKVDYMCVKEANYSYDEIVARMERCKSIFLKVCSIGDAAITRLAFAPAYVFDMDAQAYSLFVAAQLPNARFKKKSLAEANFTQTFFVEEDINGKSVWMNYLSKFETERYVQFKDGANSIMTRYTLEFDINTREEKSIMFRPDDVANFFSQAPDLGEAYLNYFFGTESAE